MPTASFTRMEEIVDTLLDSPYRDAVADVCVLTEVCNAVGVPQFRSLFMVIDISGQDDPELFIGQSVAAAVVAKRNSGQRVAGVAVSVTAVRAVPGTTGEDTDRLRRLREAGRLDLHHTAIEMTRVYGAAVDGRRWHAVRHLTGPDEGKVEGPYVFTGPARPHDTNGGNLWRLVRHSVGLPW